jgi:PAS domain S-box-containing protein
MRKTNIHIFQRLVFFLFIAEICCRSVLYASVTSEADSLEQLLPALNLEDKLKAYEKLSLIFGRKEPARAMKYDSLALEIHHRNKNDLGVSNSLNNLGLGFYAQGRYTEALNSFRESYQLKETIGDTVEIVKSLNNIGVVCQLIGDYEEAANVLMKSLQIRRQQGDSAGIARTLSNLSVLYKHTGNTMESLELLKEADAIYTRLNDSSGLASVYNNYGTVYQLLNDWELALKYYNLSLVYKENHKDERGLANTLNNIGMVLQNNRNDNEAIEYYQKAIEIRKRIKDRNGLASVYMNMATVLVSLNDYPGADNFFSEAISIAYEEGLMPMLQKAWFLRSELYQKQGRTAEALQSLHTAYNYRDSVFDKQYASKMAEWETRLKMDKAVKENTILKLEHQVSQLTIQRSRAWIMFFSVVVFTVLMVSLVLYRQLNNKKRINRQLAEANKLLEEGESKYKAVVEQSSEGIFIHWNGTIMFVNSFFEQLMAFPKDKLYRMQPEELFYGHDKSRFITLKVDQDHDPNTRHELRLVTADGRHCWVSLRQKKILLFGEPAWLCVAQDITDRKETASLVRKLELAVKQSPVSITITDSDGHIEFVNQQFTKLSGYSQEEVLGQKPSFLKSGKTEPEVYRKMWETISSGNIWYGELLNKSKDGNFYWVSASISPILDENQIITHYLSVKEDITQRKAAEQQLIENQAKLHHANVTKDKFFSIIAHDLKNPFNALIGFSQLLLTEGNSLSEEEKKEFAGNIYTASYNTYRLLENLLEWAQTQTGSIPFQQEYFDISMAIGQVMEINAVNALKKRISLTSEVPFNTTVYADYQMIMGVLRNLIANSIKFTPSGGKVHIYHHADNKNITIAIKDSGIGIPEDQLDGLFRIDQQFRREGTEAEPGTGLGLVLCKEFVSKNGGKIWVESQTGIDNRGSVFYFSLPVESHG